MTQFTDSLPSEISFTNAIEALDNQIQQIHTNRLHDSSNTTYSSHVTGIYGFESYVRKYNTRANTYYSFSPSSDDIHVLMKRYFELRAKIGNNNEFGFRVGRKATPIDAKTVAVAYSALLNFYDSQGYLTPAIPYDMKHFNFIMGVY